MAVINKNASNMDFPLQIARQYGAPLDKFEIFYTFKEAQDYATTSPLAYVGQEIKVVDEATNTTTAYIIKDKAGNLDPLGTSGDVSAVSTRVTTLEGKMTTAESNISTLQTDVKTAQTDITTLGTRVTTLDAQNIKKTGSQVITGDLTVAKNGSANGNVVVQGDLTVQGKTITENVENLNVKDNLIVTNYEGAALQGNLSGLAIKTGKDASGDPAYAIVYDPSDEAVKLGMGTIDATTNELTFDANEGLPVLTRNDSASMTNGNLIQWDGTNYKAVTSSVKAGDLALKSQLPTSFTVSASSDLLKATGGANSTAYNAYPAAEAGTGKLSKDASGNLVYGGGITATGNVTANGKILTDNKGTVTSVVAGDGLAGGTITSTGTVTHAIPSGASAGATTNTGLTVIQNVTTDKFGHVTGTATKTISAGDLGAVTSVKTLDTTATTAQAVNASEAISGTGKVTLHKISKTGSYADLLNKPTNLVTTDGTQSVTGTKTFTKIKTDSIDGLDNYPVISRDVNGATVFGDYHVDTLVAGQTMALKIGDPGTVVGFDPKDGSNQTVAYLSDLPTNSTFVDLTSTQTITGQKTFSNVVAVTRDNGINFGSGTGATILYGGPVSAATRVQLPIKAGTLALTSDIPALPTNLAKVDASNTFTKSQIVSGSSNKVTIQDSGIKVEDISSDAPALTISNVVYGLSSISLNNTSGNKSTLYFPDSKSGSQTIACMSDIPTALKSPYALTAGSKTYNGSAAVTITAADLGALTTVPKATTTALGGVMLGYAASGTNYAVQLDASGKAYVAVPWTNTTYTADNASLQLTGTVFSVKDLGITATKLANNAVTTAKILDANVTDAKIAGMNANKLTQNSGDYLILDGGNAQG